MFPGRLRLRIIITLALCALAGSSCSLAAAATKPASSAIPSAAKVRAAVARAERSSGLWATINICNTRKYPDTIGIRAQIPALGFPATLRMAVRLQSYTVASGTFEPLKGPPTTLSAGTTASGLPQEGVNFKVSARAVFDATVTFSWLSGRKLLGSTTRTTRAGIKGVDQGDPTGFSAADCRIGS